MMRGFQIWPQNSNRIRFDPFLAKKLSKWAKSDILPISDSFLAKKWVKSYPIWILRTDLESSHHFAYFRHAFDTIFAFWFFDLPCIFKTLKLNSRPLKVFEINFFVHHRTQRVWNHGKPLDLLSISKVGVFWTTLMGSAVYICQIFINLIS